MADTDVEEPQFTTLAQRIAALNQAQADNKTSPVAANPAAGKRIASPPPRYSSVLSADQVPSLTSPAIPRPAIQPRVESTNNPPITTYGSAAIEQPSNEPIGPKNGLLPPPRITKSAISSPIPSPAPVAAIAVKIPPQLPARKPVPKRAATDLNASTSPAPPSRQTTSDHTRQASSSSITSQSSTMGHGASTAARSSMDQVPNPLKMNPPPKLPSRKTGLEEREKPKARPPPVEEEAPPPMPPRPNQRPAKEPPRLPLRAKTFNTTSDRGILPPPIPDTSRPGQPMQRNDAVPPLATKRTNTDGCLICRDYSGPDQVGAQYPRASLPRGDQIEYLASVLCGPFDSKTDKARAIFTWLHHNVAYDTQAFFNNAVKNVSPSDTIRSGRAVCGGYAGLYSAIALKAGLECVVVTGHGKGYGHAALSAESPVPPKNPTGHAWNAVRIDGGEWKLVDPCWGAGYLENRAYNQRFNASMFTMSNEEFGKKHFPADKKQFYRADGKNPSWETYMRGSIKGEPVQTYSWIHDNGIAEASIQPAAKAVAVKSKKTNVFFELTHVCPHWDPATHGSGPAYCLVLKVNGRKGRHEDFVPFEYDGYRWVCRVPAGELGIHGQSVTLFAVTSLNGDAAAARGLSLKDYLARKGRVAMGFDGVAHWELVDSDMVLAEDEGGDLDVAGSFAVGW